MPRTGAAIVIFILLAGCSPVSRKALTKQLKETENKFQDHIGFMLYDPEKKKSIVDYNASRYFTPASNTKIFTLFTCLNILGDSIPALQYTSVGDSLFFRGTGDPSFLNRNVFDNGSTYSFLNQCEKLFYFPGNFFTTHFGPGWSWEDYPYAFSAERSGFPIYGNVFEITEGPAGKLLVNPPAFSEIVAIGDSLDESKIVRAVESNRTDYRPGRRSREMKWTIPFRSDSTILIKLLEDTLKRDVVTIDSFPGGKLHTLYSIPADSLYRVMMQESDNFIAEQLLLLCANALSDSLKPEIAIRYAMENLLQDLPDRPVWVDGSGLSRYNLFTPRSIVKLWEKIMVLVPEDRLFQILATGGKPGTLRNYFKSDIPYVFGKTGTLSNIHCLSGYLITKKGKRLIFSFMNANFTTRVREVRTMMEETLNMIHEKY